MGESPNPMTSQSLSPLQIPVSPEIEDTLVRIVKDDFDKSKAARDKRDYGITAKGDTLSFDKWLKGIEDIYQNRREAKTVPWRFCSNRSLRIATSILDMIHARILPTIVNEDLVRWTPMNSEDAPKTERINKLMHWWVWVHSHLRPFFDNFIKVTCGYGDSLVESSWVKKVDYISDPIEEPQVDELGQPIMGADGQPQVSTFKDIRYEEFTKSRIHLKKNVYLQEGSRDIQEEPVLIEESFFYRELEEGESAGIYMNVTNMLRLKIPFQEPSGLMQGDLERIRSIKIRNYSVKVHKWYHEFDVDGDGINENVVIFIAPDYDLYLGGIMLKHVTKTGKKPLTFTKFASRLNCPEENDGEGVVEQVKELAEEVDAIFNQLTDANTLSVMRPGFYDPNGDLDAKALTLAPNKMIPVTNPTQNVYFPDMRIPIDQLINAIRLVMEFVERLTAASSYMLGKESEIVGGSGTATRTNAIVQSAEIRYGAPTQRLREGIASVLEQHLDLLQLNIPEGLETRVLGEDNMPIFKPNELSQEGIAGKFDCYLLLDPSQGSKQTERELAGMLYSVLLQNPLVATDPAKIYRITADLLKPYGKNPEELLGPAPEIDTVDDPDNENTLILQGDFDQVKAQIYENHLLHIKKHEDLLASPSLPMLPPALLQEVTMYTQHHIEEHKAMMQLVMGMMKQYGGGASSNGTKPTNGKPNSGADRGFEGAQTFGRMENTSGPLGSALDSQRKGESGGNP